MEPVEGTVVAIGKSGRLGIILLGGLILFTAKPVTGYAIGDKLTCTVDFTNKNIRTVLKPEDMEDICWPDGWIDGPPEDDYD